MNDRMDGSTKEPGLVELLCVTDRDHTPISGSVAAVAEAVRSGSDLRRFSTYKLKGAGMVEETMTLQTTWVFDERNVGGLQTLRHPVDCGLGIKVQPSLALWIFPVGVQQRSTFVPLEGIPMADATDQWAQVNNNPYGADDEEFVPQRYQWWARSDWEQICAHDELGNPFLGSWKNIHAAAHDGCVLKVGVKNLWSDFASDRKEFRDHEVFVECTTDFSHVDGEFFGSLTQPTFLIQPCIPLIFTDGYYALGWLVVRSDGRIQRRVLNPSTMQWEQKWGRYAVRWFAR